MEIQVIELEDEVNVVVDGDVITVNGRVVSTGNKAFAIVRIQVTGVINNLSSDVDVDVVGNVSTIHAGEVSVKGDVGEIDAEGDVRVKGNVQGQVTAGTDIVVEGNVNGDVRAEGDVRIEGNVQGSVNSNIGNVECKDVGQYVLAGEDVNCGNVTGNVHAGRDLITRRRREM
jgi:cytoskeletal protein CcmA (bactofilin family)